MGKVSPNSVNDIRNVGMLLERLKFAFVEFFVSHMSSCHRPTPILLYNSNYSGFGFFGNERYLYYLFSEPSTIAASDVSCAFAR